MNLLQDFSKWYFTRNALPYWCILLLDLLTVALSCLFGFYLTHGDEIFAEYFWNLAGGIAVCLVIFAFYFKVLHTYSGVMRYTSFIDLYGVIAAVICGSATCSLLEHILVKHFPELNIIIPDWRTFVIVFCMASLVMWVERVVVKTLFDMFRTEPESIPAFIYGVRQGGVSIAKSIRNDEKVRYDLKGFISPEGDLTGMYLLGEKVYPAEPETIEVMKSMKVKVLFISHIQADRFRNDKKLTDALSAADIKILLMTEEEFVPDMPSEA